MASTYYATLPELKAAINMAASVTDRDGPLTIALDAAHEDVNEHCGRRFDIAAAVAPRIFDACDSVVQDGCGQRLLVDDIGDLTGLIVETGGPATWTALAATAYETRPLNAPGQGRPVTGLLLISGRWAAGTARVRVTAKWGWPAVPGKVKQATLLQAARLYKRRESPEGVAGASDWGAVRVARIDPDVQALLAHYVLPGF